MSDTTLKAAIFDIDGVILDSMGIWQDLGVRYLESLGIKAQEGLSETIFPMSMEQGAQYIADTYPVGRNSDKVSEDLENIIRDFYFNEVKAKDGARDVLEMLTSRGIRIAAATSSPRQHVTKALERLNLLEYFQRIFTTTEVGQSKHCPLIYKLAAEFLKTSEKQTLVFEDSLYALTTAADAGFHTVGVFDPYGETDQEGLMNKAETYILSMKDFRI